MKRIVIVTSYARSFFLFRKRLIEQLLQDSIEVFALAPDFDEITTKEVESMGATVISYKMSRAGQNIFSDLYGIYSLLQEISKIKADYLLCYFAKPVIYGSVIGWALGIKKRLALIEGLGYAFSNGANSASKISRVRRYIVSKLYKFSLSKAHRIFLLNQEDFDELKELGACDEEKSCVLGGIGVDLSLLKPLPTVQSPITFMIAARLLKAKGILIFCDAARKIKATSPHIRFVVLGSIDENPDGLSENEMHALVNEGIIEWPGYVPVADWFEQTSVFVLPSYYREGVPRSIQEACAFGKAIITTDSIGCRDTVIDGFNGFLVPTKSSEAVYEKMLTFIRNPALIKSMGINSRKLAEERFDESVKTDILFRALTEN